MSWRLSCVVMRAGSWGSLPSLRISAIAFGCSFRAASACRFSSSNRCFALGSDLTSSASLTFWESVSETGPAEVAEGQVASTMIHTTAGQTTVIRWDERFGETVEPGKERRDRDRTQVMDNI